MTCETCGADTYPAPDDSPAAGFRLCEGCDGPTDACTCADDTECELLALEAAGWTPEDDR